MRTSTRGAFWAERFLIVVMAACCFFRYGVLHADFSLKAKAAFAAVDESAWTWDVLVIPPEKGWENAAGESIRRTLAWHQTRISESGDGIHGHDLQFVLLPPTSEDMEGAAKNYVLPVASHTVAVLSFASYPLDRELIKHAARTGVPLLLAGGENVFLYERGRLSPFVFALDLFQDYRCRAFADYATKTLEKKYRLSVMGARFTLNEEREAKICFDLLSEAGFIPMPYWLDASVTDTFTLVEQEIKAAGDGVLLCYVGGMASKEIWRGVMRNSSPCRLWYGGAPDASFRSFKGMVFADQNMYLDERGGFEQLKRDLWMSRTVSISDKVAAGRANALALWLIQALGAIPGQNLEKPHPKELISKLESAAGIPFGAQVLDIDATTHRPRQRKVHILEVRDRNFTVLDTLDVKGLPYYDY
ncbi:MAG: hypothetical protein LBO68_03775 [Synergistaceae bacterium]|nr:hypothetical protein [Synergistaceae bacterium]